MVDIELCGTGIEELDFQMNGGIPSGNTVLVTGCSGSGKTTLLVNEALKFLPIENTEKMVRINPLTIFGREDLNILMENPSFDTILLPKCESADDVRRADETITFYEKLYNYNN